MQGVTGRGLERVRDGVSVVEDGAHAGSLELVGRDDPRLDLDAPGDHLREHGGIAREQCVDVRRGEVVAHQRVLGDLTQAAAVLAVGQRGEHRRVHEHGARLVERTDEVLALGQVHAGLAADRAVDHREQRGRHLHDVDPAVVDRRREAGRVADDPAAHREHEVAAQQAPFGEAAAQRFDRRERLGVLAFAHLEGAGVGSGRRQGVAHRATAVAVDRRLGDDRDPAPAAYELGQRVVVVRDHHVVAAVAEVDANARAHDASSA